MGPYSKSSTTSNWKSDLSRPGKLKNWRMQPLLLEKELEEKTLRMDDTN